MYVQEKRSMFTVVCKQGLCKQAFPLYLRATEVIMPLNAIRAESSLQEYYRGKQVDEKIL
jgi:hypothetical protein